jgi:hypothetical protein
MSRGGVALAALCYGSPSVSSLNSEYVDQHYQHEACCLLKTCSPDANVLLVCFEC